MKIKRSGERGIVVLSVIYKARRHNYYSQLFTTTMAGSSDAKLISASGESHSIKGILLIMMGSFSFSVSTSYLLLFCTILVEYIII